MQTAGRRSRPPRGDHPVGLGRAPGRSRVRRGWRPATLARHGRVVGDVVLGGVRRVAQRDGDRGRRPRRRLGERGHAAAARPSRGGPRGTADRRRATGLRPPIHRRALAGHADPGRGSRRAADHHVRRARRAGLRRARRARRRPAGRPGDPRPGARWRGGRRRRGRARRAAHAPRARDRGAPRARRHQPRHRRRPARHAGDGAHPRAQRDGQDPDEHAGAPRGRRHLPWLPARDLPK